MTTLALFMPLAKVDADRRIVEGVATAELPDRSGEICDYASSKPYFEAWSEEAQAASGGKSLGAVRAMHGPIAAGKLTDIQFDDEGKRIVVVAKIVDDAEWEKVLEGVYTGFSQGGRYVKRWDDEETGLTRYTAEPTEISLVDMPCLPDATFEIVKNGVSEFRKFTLAEAKAEAPASPPPEPRPQSLEAVSKAALAISLAAEKLERAVDENSALRKALAELEPRLHKMEDRIKAIEAQPVAPRAALRSVRKDLDFGAEAARPDNVDDAIRQLASLPDDQRALALTKISLANPLARAF